MDQQIYTYIYNQTQIIFPLFRTFLEYFGMQLLEITMKFIKSENLILFA